MSNQLILDVSTELSVADYKKHADGKRINKFMLCLDKLIADAKIINPNRVTFSKDGTMYMQVADRYTPTGDSVSTMSTFAEGMVNLEDASYKTVLDLFEGFDFTIDIPEFIELRKLKTSNPVYKLIMSDSDKVVLELLDGEQFTFKYNTDYLKDIEEVDTLMSNSVLLNTEPFTLDDPTMLSNLQSKKPSDIFSTYFDTSEMKILVDSYYSEPNSTSTLAHIDLCKKFLIGFRPSKKKDIYHYPQIEGNVYGTKSPHDGRDIKLIEITIYNDTHIIQQTFITV